VIDEEATSQGTQTLVRDYRVDAAIVVEPFGLGRVIVSARPEADPQPGLRR
jgi:hypothetical protein